MHQLLLVNKVEQIEDIKNIFIPGRGWTKFQDGAQLLGKHLFLGIDEQTGAGIVNANVETEILLLNIEMLMYAQIDFAGKRIPYLFKPLLTLVLVHQVYFQRTQCSKCSGILSCIW